MLWSRLEKKSVRSGKDNDWDDRKDQKAGNKRGHDLKGTNKNAEEGGEILEYTILPCK